MKQKQPTTTSTQQQTSKRSVDEYGYPLYLDAENDPALWVDCPDAWSKRFVDVIDYQSKLKRPNPPTPEAVARAQFVDKTYVWKEPGKAVKPS